MRPRWRGTRWAVGTAASASAVLSYFVPTHATAVTNITVRRLVAERPARPPAKPAGSPSLRTKATSGGPVNVARVQAWRAHHPGYWRKGRCVGPALQDVSMAQPIGSTIETANLVRSPLQDVLSAQPAVLIGLIAHLVGTPLQDDIVRTTDRLLRLGQDILATSAARAATPAPDCGAGRDRLRDVLQNPRLP